MENGCQAALVASRQNHLRLLRIVIVSWSCPCKSRSCGLVYLYNRDRHVQEKHSERRGKAICVDHIGQSHDEATGIFHAVYMKESDYRHFEYLGFCHVDGNRRHRGFVRRGAIVRRLGLLVLCAPTEGHLDFLILACLLHHAAWQLHPDFVPLESLTKYQDFFALVVVMLLSHFWSLLCQNLLYRNVYGWLLQVHRHHRGTEARESGIQRAW